MTDRELMKHVAELLADWPVKGTQSVMSAEFLLRERLAQPDPELCQHEWVRTGAMPQDEARCLKCGAWKSEGRPKSGLELEFTYDSLAIKISNEASPLDEFKKMTAELWALRKEVEILRAQKTQPDPEPVAWKDMAFARLGVVRNKMRPEDVDTVQRFLDGDYTAPPKREPDPEPVAFGYLWPTGMHPEFRYTQQKRGGIDGTPVYTAPPRREWHGLTEEEILKVLGLEGYDSLALENASAIEAALRERNT